MTRPQRLYRPVSSSSLSASSSSSTAPSTPIAAAATQTTPHSAASNRERTPGAITPRTLFEPSPLSSFGGHDHHRRAHHTRRNEDGQEYNRSFVALNSSASSADHAKSPTSSQVDSPAIASASQIHSHSDDKRGKRHPKAKKSYRAKQSDDNDAAQTVAVVPTSSLPVPRVERKLFNPYAAASRSSNPAFTKNVGEDSSTSFHLNQKQQRKSFDNGATTFATTTPSKYDPLEKTHSTPARLPGNTPAKSTPPYQIVSKHHSDAHLHPGSSSGPTRPLKGTTSNATPPSLTMRNVHIQERILPSSNEIADYTRNSRQLYHSTLATLTKALQPTGPIPIVDYHLQEVNESIVNSLKQTNSEFTVIGIIGTEGIGKSTIMSSLVKPISDSKSAAFPIHSHPLSKLQSYPDGINMIITPNRTILLDTPSIFSPSLKNYIMPKVKQPGCTEDELYNILMLRLSLLLLRVCHVLIIATEWPVPSAMRLLLQTAFSTHKKLLQDSDSNVILLQQPEIVFVFNKIDMSMDSIGARTTLYAMQQFILSHFGKYIVHGPNPCFERLCAPGLPTDKVNMITLPFTLNVFLEQQNSTSLMNDYDADQTRHYFIQNLLEFTMQLLTMQVSRGTVRTEYQWWKHTESAILELQSTHVLEICQKMVKDFPFS